MLKEKADRVKARDEVRHSRGEDEEEEGEEE